MTEDARVTHTGPVFVIFDGPPGAEAGRFVEVEAEDGQSIKVGEWTDTQWKAAISRMRAAQSGLSEQEIRRRYPAYWKLGPFYTSALLAQRDALLAELRASLEVMEKVARKSAWDEALEPYIDSARRAIARVEEGA